MFGIRNLKKLYVGTSGTLGGLSARCGPTTNLQLLFAHLSFLFAFCFGFLPLCLDYYFVFHPCRCGCFGRFSVRPYGYFDVTADGGGTTRAVPLFSWSHVAAIIDRRPR